LAWPFPGVIPRGERNQRQRRCNRPREAQPPCDRATHEGHAPALS
jgi:hypothetical protein